MICLYYIVYNYVLSQLLKPPKKEKKKYYAPPPPSYGYHVSLFWYCLRCGKKNTTRLAEVNFCLAYCSLSFSIQDNTYADPYGGYDHHARYIFFTNYQKMSNISRQLRTVKTAITKEIITQIKFKSLFRNYGYWGWGPALKSEISCKDDARGFFVFYLSIFIYNNMI